ncbi:MAG: TM0106 family RecB-like putative nuclease [Chroococcidiopsidaceae cyanobacterium CP_BM_ER_R8_30]|nr:TM0106 family RecB-like putative nuclease [Chroococcidiopsidaceae cyanobacterium CP_BM_ER_R8_30]
MLRTKRSKEVNVLKDVACGRPAGIPVRPEASSGSCVDDVKCYVVHLTKWMPQMQQVLENCIQTIQSLQAPEVFITRQRCSLCRWYSSCYTLAKSQQHLSLLPGVTPSRYTQLQALNLTSIKSLANSSPAQLEPVFGSKVAQHLVLQAQSILHQQPILSSPSFPSSLLSPSFPIELYFDIEAEPDLNLDYLLGVLVVDRSRKTETFHSLMAERPQDEELIWQKFLDLVWQYPLAPIFHFCSYEVDTVKRLAKLYHTPKDQVQPLMNRFVDLYEHLTQTVVLPVESYALKSIARWIGFDWHNPQANGSQCIYWYDQWLKTGDRTFLDAIQRYNEDDCRATYLVKDWLMDFVQNLDNRYLV